MRVTRALLLLSMLGLISGSAAAKPWWMRGIDSNDTDFLPPDAAFRVAAQVDGGVVRVRWIIADGYYMYRRKIEVAAESPGLVVSAIALPNGIPKNDPYLGTQEIFLHQVEGTVAYKRLDFGAHPIQIKVTYQGCAEAGLCYLPISKVLFPQSPGASTVQSPPHTWEVIAILGGAGAFLIAGVLLRRGRRLDLPAP